MVTDDFLTSLHTPGQDMSQWRVIKSLDELDVAIAKLMSFMNNVGLPFLDKFNNLADFDKWFNDPVLSGQYNFQTGQNWNDSLGGLIAAKMNNNPKYEEIFSIWMQKMNEKGNDPQTIKELQATKRFLDGLSVGS